LSARRLANSWPLSILYHTPPDESESGLDESTEAESKEVWRPAFHDVLKASGMRLAVPLQMVRRPRMKGGGDPAALDRCKTRRHAPGIFTRRCTTRRGASRGDCKGARLHSQLVTSVSAFYRSAEGDRLLTSVAQVFNERGEGVIVRGAPAQLDKSDRTPHLSSADARMLIASAIATYRREHRTSPARVVIHKTSKLSDSESQGFSEAAKTRQHRYCRSGERATFVHTSVRMEMQPPLRGTLLHLGRQMGLLYLRGSVSFFETYPGLYVPRPLEFDLAHSDSTVFGGCGRTSSTFKAELE